MLGVACGSLAGHYAKVHRKDVVLLLVAALLGGAAALAMAGARSAAIGAMALAMGAENAVFERGGETRIGLTYMNGTLVKLGQRLTIILRSGDRSGGLSYLMLWIGLVAGAVAGASAYAVADLAALWLGAAAATAFAMFSVTAAD